MRLALLLLVSVVGACSKGPEADLQYISKARSLAAEWALVNELAVRGELTDAYVSTMRKSLREQLESASKAVTEPDAPYAREIRAIAAAPADASPTALRAASERLKLTENELESA